VSPLIAEMSLVRMSEVFAMLLGRGRCPVADEKSEADRVVFKSSWPPRTGDACSNAKLGSQNKALQQNRGDVLRCGESIGCDLLKAAVSRGE
jgi:hypothetical protein